MLDTFSKDLTIEAHNTEQVAERCRVLIHMKAALQLVRQLWEL
jgi:hypothetical protein